MLLQRREYPCLLFTELSEFGRPIGNLKVDIFQPVEYNQTLSLATLECIGRIIMIRRVPVAVALNFVKSSCKGCTAITLRAADKLRVLIYSLFNTADAHRVNLQWRALSFDKDKMSG